MIVGGGGVGLIPCDLGCINGVDSSLQNFFFGEFCVDFRDFFKSSIGWWWQAVLVYGGGFLF